MSHYFAYGTNMDPRLMQKAVPQATPAGHGRLEGYRVEFNVYSDRWQGGAANLEPDRDAHVWGIVWELGEDDLPKLDTYVGHPTYYRREEVTVETDAGSVDCITYRVAHQSGYVRPTDPYLNRLRQAIRMQGLPPEALDILEAAARPPRPQIS